MTITKKEWQKFYNVWEKEKIKAQKLVKPTQKAKIGWKVIHQRKIKVHDSIWEKYLEYIDTYPQKSETDIEKNTGIHWRATIYLRYLGFLHKKSSGNNQIITEPGKKFYKTPNQREELLQQQVEKWYYCVRNFFRPGDDSYSIYPFFVLLKVLLLIGEKLPKYKPQYFISMDEFRYFVITIKKYEECEKRVDFIIDYRQSNYKQKQVLENIFSNTSFDRIIFILGLSKFFKFTDQGVYIKKSLLLKAQKLKDNFDELYKQNLVRFYQKERKRYLKMLYSDMTLVERCKEDEEINKFTNELIRIEKKKRITKKDEQKIEEKIKPFIKPTKEETINRIKRILDQRKNKVKKVKTYPPKKQSLYTTKDAKKKERTVGKILAIYYGKCQISDCGYYFLKGKDGKKGPYCEAHHLQKLSDDGKDIPENIVVLCANHHCMFHYNDPKIISRDEQKLVVELCGENKIINIKL